MRHVLLRGLAAACLLAVGPVSAGPDADAPAGADTAGASDAAAIRASALDYIDGWYTGDAARMERALHPRLAKRVVSTDARGHDHLLESSALELVQDARAGGGKDIPVAERRDAVRLLDRFGDTAVVRVDAADWVDYLELARFDGRWVIVNVLWEPRPKG